MINAVPIAVTGTPAQKAGWGGRGPSQEKCLILRPNSLGERSRLAAVSDTQSRYKNKRRHQRSNPSSHPGGGHRGSDIGGVGERARPSLLFAATILDRFTAASCRAAVFAC